MVRMVVIERWWLEWLELLCGVVVVRERWIRREIVVRMERDGG